MYDCFYNSVSGYLVDEPPFTGVLLHICIVTLTTLQSKKKSQSTSSIS
jgi:hypothetical protein